MQITDPFAAAPAATAPTRRPRAAEAVSRPVIQNFILTLGFIAFVAGAVHLAVALPTVMHGTAAVAPHGWEEVLMEALEAGGQ